MYCCYFDALTVFNVFLSVPSLWPSPTASGSNLWIIQLHNKVRASIFNPVFCFNKTQINRLPVVFMSLKGFWLFAPCLNLLIYLYLCCFFFKAGKKLNPSRQILIIYDLTFHKLFCTWDKIRSSPLSLNAARRRRLHESLTTYINMLLKLWLKPKWFNEM